MIRSILEAGVPFITGVTIVKPTSKFGSVGFAYFTEVEYIEIIPDCIDTLEMIWCELHTDSDVHYGNIICS